MSRWELFGVVFWTAAIIVLGTFLLGEWWAVL